MLAAYIDGVERTDQLRLIENVEGEYALGSRAVLRCEFIDEGPDGDRPEMDQSIELLDALSGDSLFFGEILSTDDQVIERAVTVTPIDAVDEWKKATGRLVPTRTYTEQTLKAIVTDLMLLLDVFGLTLDPGMLDGPPVTVPFDYEDVGAAFDKLSTLTGWVYRLLPTGVVEWFEVGTAVAPFTLSDALGNVRQITKLKRTRDANTNVVVVKYGPPAQVPKPFHVTGNGVTDTWALDYKAVTIPDGHLVPYNGLMIDETFSTTAPVLIGVVGTDPQPHWNYNPATNQLIRSAGPLGAGVAAYLPSDYAVQFPLIVSASDDADVAARGPSERIHQDDKITDAAVALTLAQALLRQAREVPRILGVLTPEGPAFPGDVVPCDLRDGAISGDWLITSMRFRDQDDRTLIYEYECIEGSERRESWIDFWRSLIGGSSGGSSGSVSGVLIPPTTTGTGGGSSVAPTRLPMFLGGSSVEFVESPTPTWVPASAVRVTLDTAARGTTAATISARLRATAGSVQARLYNVTTSAAVGSSAVVSSTSWTDVTFSATLTTGSNVYELQVIPSLQSTPVAAVGYVI